MKQLRNHVLGLLVLLTGTILFGQNPPEASSVETIEQYKTLIKETMQKSNLVGVGAALILGDGTIWKEGFGYADKENNIPFTTEAVVRIGSLTKPFTALGIMQLQERGLLDIDQPLKKYLPQFAIRTRKADIKQITLRSVITHTSGLPNDILWKAEDENEKYTNTLKYVENEYLAYPPRTIFHYSNIGYCLLGHTILAVSKQEYPDFIQENILLPIGMKNSGFPGHHKLDHISRIYDSDGTILEPIRQRNIPAGYLFSNIDDMLRFAQELIAVYHGKQGSIVRPETLKRIFTEQVDIAKILRHRMGLGFTMFRNDSAFAIFHFGSDNVSNAFLVIEPEKRIAAIVLSNTAGGNVLSENICAKFLESCGLNDNDYYISGKRGPDVPERIEASPAALKRHVGLYAHTRGLMIEIAWENNELKMKGDLGDFLLRPVSSDEFIPCKVQSPGQPEIRAKGRIIFRNISGDHVIIWQDNAQKEDPLAYRLSAQTINKTWISRLGNYRIVGDKSLGKEAFSRVELSLSDSRVMQLKIFYTSGEYLYNLRIENANELVFCGFDETMGGDTIRFNREKRKDIMLLYGLTLVKN